MALKYTAVAILVLGAFIQSSTASCGCGCNGAKAPAWISGVSGASASAQGVPSVSYSSVPASAGEACSECGFIRVPDEAPRQIQYVLNGPAPAGPLSTLPYQVEVPVVAQQATGGAQYGVRFEAAAPCAKPQLPASLGSLPYAVEVPQVATYDRRLQPQAVKLVAAACAPQKVPDVRYNVGYAVEVPRMTCAPKLTNLKAQVDRVVVPAASYANGVETVSVNAGNGCNSGLTFASAGPAQTASATYYGNGNGVRSSSCGCA